MKSSPERQAQFRSAIEAFLQARIAIRLAESGPGHSGTAEDVRKQYAFEAWIKTASAQARQVQLVTHPLRATFPEAKISTTTSLYCPPDALPAHRELGTHSLNSPCSVDTAGNAAVSVRARDELRAFMQIEVAGAPLRSWILSRDLDLMGALNGDAEIALTLAADLAAFLQRPEPLSSHARAKQVYWLAGEDPADDNQFHLLAPLLSSTLAHAVFLRIEEDRFGENSKLARKARREFRDNPSGFSEYPDLAIQRIGGSKPQNVTQLNNERHGNNYLLASCPPKWKTRALKAPLFTDTVFPTFGRIEEVRSTVRILRNFLQSDPPPTMETRNRRDALFDRLIDELIDFAQPLQAILPNGWTRNKDCRLVEAERLWLDPGRAESGDETDTEFVAAWQRMDWPVEIGRRFGNWLNHELGQSLPLGDIEGRFWRDELLLHTAWAGRLHTLRVQGDVPTYISVREAVQ